MDGSPEDRVLAGAPREDALQAFQECVNQPGTIFSRDHWLLPKLDDLRRLLPDPIAAEHAAALLDVLFGRRFMRELIGWLQAPGVDWRHYPIYSDFMQEKQQREREDREDRLFEEIQQEIDWGPRPTENERREQAMRDYLANARPCPKCSAPPECLEWYPTPPPPRHARGGYVGWHTRCKSCRIEVDFFCGAHWTRGSLHICRCLSSAIN